MAKEGKVHSGKKDFPVRIAALTSVHNSMYDETKNLADCFKNSNSYNNLPEISAEVLNASTPPCFCNNLQSPIFHVLVMFSYV